MSLKKSSLRQLLARHAKQDALKTKWWNSHLELMRASGQEMRNQREQRNLSLRELARRLKITAPFLSDMELGRRFYSIEWVKKAIAAMELNTKSARSSGEERG